MCKCALCTVDDTCHFHVIRLELKTSVYEMNVTVVSTVTGCDVTTVQLHYKGSTSITAGVLTREAVCRRTAEFCAGGVESVGEWVGEGRGEEGGRERGYEVWEVSHFD